MKAKGNFMNKEKREEHSHVSIATCVKVWVGIVALVVLSYVIFLMQIEPLWLRRTLFTAMALLQGALGVTYFMQLRAERPGLIYAVVVPVSLLIGLVVFGIGEGDYVFGLRKDKQWVTTERPKPHENGDKNGDKHGEGETPVDLVEKGFKVATAQGCLGCHSSDGTKIVGPTWKGLYSSERELEGSATAVADEAYLHESIVDPNAKVTKGYLPVMPPFTKLSEEEIQAIIAYMKSLSPEEKK
jgi:caa(3)-type oxidase subunit IV